MLKVISLLIIFILVPFIFYKIYCKRMKFSFFSRLEILLFICVSNLITLFLLRYIFKINFFDYSIVHYSIYFILLILVNFLLINFWKNKLKPFFNKISSFIEKMSNRKWMTTSFILLFIFMMAVSVPMIYEPWIMVEDGFVFLNQQFSMGINSFFVFYGGYCNFVSRLSALLAAHLGKFTNSIIVTVMVIKWITIFYEVIIINYFNDNCFNWLVKSRSLRLVYSIILMYMMGNFQFLFYNTTSVHWFCGLLCFFVGVNLIKGKMPKSYILPFLLIGILSSPSTLALGFALLYYFVKKIQVKSLIKGTLKNIGLVNFIKMFLIAICLLLQIIAILSGGGTGEMIGNSIIDTFYHVTLLILQVPTYLLGVGVALKFNDIYFSTSLGILLLLLFGFVFYKKGQMHLFIYGILTIFCLYFMILFKNSSGDYYLYLYNNKYWFYHALPGTIVVFLELLVIEYLFNLNKWKYKNLFYFVIFVFVCQHLYVYSFEYTDLLWEIEDRVNFESDVHVSVPIFPDDGRWYLNVPVDVDE